MSAAEIPNMAPSTVAALRRRLGQNGFRPLELHSHDKRPFGDAWQDRARLNPPEATTTAPHSAALNTGLLCDGLRALDIDIDDPALAERLEALALRMLGTAPVRWRGNSGRRLLLYRADEGEPGKRVLAGTLGKLEILGRGQQLHAFGIHPSGAALRWRPDGPDAMRAATLPPVTEGQVDAFLSAAAPMIGAELPKAEKPASAETPRTKAHASMAEVRDVLARIPNHGPADWEAFNKIGMAIFAALGGAAEGRALFAGWAERNAAYDGAEVDGRWQNYQRSPPSMVGMATLLRLARQPEPWPALQRDLATAEPLPPPPLTLADFPAPWPVWIARAAEGAGAPADYVACALLAVTGAVIGNARWGSPWEGWSHPPVVYFACVGLPSAGKSPAIGAVAEPAAEMAADLNDDFAERMRTWRTSCQEAKERRALWEADVKVAVRETKAVPGEPAGARDPERPTKRRIYTTDPTLEAARDLSASNPRGMLLHRDELAGWIAGMDRYGGGAGGTDRAFWLQAYEGGRWTSDRVKDGDDGREIPHLTWGIVGGIQPDRLASMLLSGDDDGLSGRFIYTWPATRADVSKPPTGDGLPFPLKPMLARLRALPVPEDAGRVTLPFTADAVDALQEWRREVRAMEGDAAGLYLSWLGKLPGMAVRLAVIFLHLKWLGQPDDTSAPVEVDGNAMVRALGFLADYAVPMARRAFGEAALPEAERDARRLARWLLRQSPIPETLNARALRRMGNGPGVSTPERIETALAELAELGWVRPAPDREGGGKGRQRADWTTNPALREPRP